MQTQEKPNQFFCVVESPEGLSALLRQSDVPVSDIRIFCSCSETEALLESRGLPFESLSEDVLKNEWEGINAWAKRASLTWYLEAVVSHVITLDGINLGDLCNRPISHSLIYQLKNYRLAHIISERIRGEEFIFIEKEKEAVSGQKGKGGTINDMLRLILKRESAALAPLRASRAGSASPDLISWARRIVGVFYRWFFSPKLREGIFVGAGTLKIILPVLARLNRTAQCVFLDESFQWATYRTCRKQGIDYRLFSTFLDPAEKVEWRRRWDRGLAAVRACAEAIEELPCFQYQGMRIPGLSDGLFAILEKQSFERFLQAVMCRKLQEKHGVRACLLHEDADQFRGFAVASRALKMPVVVISHGIPPTRSDWSESAKGIGVADTVVNSEFEKDKYMLSGYPPELLHVLGLPRYDYIHKRLTEARHAEGGRKVILYCPHMLTRATKREKGYLGIHTPGGVTRQNSVALFKAIENIDCELRVKPHGNSRDIHLWQELISQQRSEKIRLVPHTADIFELIASCDLVVATFSTVVIEAMLFQKDVVTLNFTSEPDIHPYAERGIACGVYHPDDLAETIRKCFFDASMQMDLRTARAREMLYFGGPFDGANTKRATDFIEQLSRPQSSPTETEKCQTATI